MWLALSSQALPRLSGKKYIKYPFIVSAGGQLRRHLDACNVEGKLQALLNSSHLNPDFGAECQIYRDGVCTVHEPNSGETLQETDKACARTPGE